MEWTYNLRIRSKNAAAAVQKTFAPAAHPVQLGPPVYEDIVLERELISYARPNFVKGCRAYVTIVLESVDGRVTALATYDELEEVLNGRFTAGNYLEVGLHGAGTFASDTTADYKRCNLTSAIEYSMPGGKATAVHLELEFEGYAIQTTEYSPDNGTTW